MIEFGSYKNMLSIFVKVIPGASKDAIVKDSNKELKIKITAQPQKGKANDKLIRFLSKSLGLKKSDIIIVKGEKTRNKIIAFNNCDENLLIDRLTNLLKL